MNYFFKKQHKLNYDIYISKNKLTDNIYLCYKPINNIPQKDIYQHNLQIPCQDGQYIQIQHKLYKLNYIEIKNNKIIYYFENDVILEIIKTKNNRLIYNLFSSSNSYLLFIGFIKKKIFKKYNLLSPNDNIELDLIYNLLLK